MTDLEELKKKFILEEDAEKLNIEELITKISNFCQVDKIGFVQMNEMVRDKLPIKEKILLVLTARVLAKTLQEKLGEELTISDIVSGDELSKIVGVQKTVVAARAKDLKDERKIVTEKRGYYKVAPHYIEAFVRDLTLQKELISNAR